MVINFMTRKISRGAHKLARTFTSIKKKNHSFFILLNQGRHGEDSPNKGIPFFLYATQCTPITHREVSLIPELRVKLYDSCKFKL